MDHPHFRRLQTERHQLFHVHERSQESRRDAEQKDAFRNRDRRSGRVHQAMKLENEVVSPFDGEVKEIKVTKSSQVNNKDVLVLIG